MKPYQIDDSQSVKANIERRTTHFVEKKRPARPIKVVNSFRIYNFLISTRAVRD